MSSVDQQDLKAEALLSSRVSGAAPAESTEHTQGTCLALGMPSASRPAVAGTAAGGDGQVQVAAGALAATAVADSDSGVLLKVGPPDGGCHRAGCNAAGRGALWCCCCAECLHHIAGS